MRKFLEKHLPNLVIFLSGVMSYFVLSQLLDVHVSIDHMFDGFWKEADTVSYLEVANWIFKGVPTENLAYRPIVFPLIIGVTVKLGGIWLLWAFQLFCYTVAHYFVHKAVFNATNKRGLAILSSVFYLSNFSLIGISYHALTECLVILMLAALVFSYTKAEKKETSLAAFFYCTWAILGILSIIKPVFAPLFWVISGLILYMLVRKKWRLKRKHIVFSITIALLFLAQCTIIYENYGKFKVSTIGEKTLKDYLCVQILQESKTIDRERAQQMVAEWSSEDVLQLFRDEPVISVKYYFRNMDANIRSDSFVERYDHPSINKTPAIYMRTYNDVLMFIFVVIFVWIGLRWARSTPKDNAAILNLMLFLLMLYVILTSGIAHSQRDRIIVILLPIWIFLLSNLIHSIQTRKKPKHSRPT